eukprot:TRINITY_DN10710_c0_g1_i1.p1 TRINITY_DN10710_c0_g1~~TRINITY_DN10710_c0_g1_i1.p1  ORF type:complete len:468 (+),score=55.54 TRINITY_DN10710_c0_g1_i1:19-1422(+)
MHRVRALLALRGNGVIGIRREDKNNWERRVPLTPRHVGQLVAGGTSVLVQPSSIRCFSDEEYVEAGAQLAEDLSPAHTILAVKEVPIHHLLANRTYLFFSHTHKAQPHNMPLLDAVLERNVRLIDFEHIVDCDGRVVKFGPYAGYAGMINTLHALGLALLARGFATPFLHVSRAREYRCLDTARQALLQIGQIIRTKGLPREVAPLTVVVTGSGSVSAATQQILHTLPCTYLDPCDLPALFAKAKPDRHCIYVAVATEQHMVSPCDRLRRFDRQAYYSDPSSFEPVFHENIAPYAKVLVNGMYWESKYPKLLTLEQTRVLREQQRFPLLALGDISCDPKGPIEISTKSTTIADPFYCVDLNSLAETEVQKINADCVVVLAVDHLPAEFPSQASEYFGDPLCDLARAVALSDGSKAFEDQTDLPPEVRTAVVAAHGKLTPNYQYISKLNTKACWPVSGRRHECSRATF